MSLPRERRLTAPGRAWPKAAGVILIALAAAPAFADGPYRVVVERGVEAKMRDTTELSADIYRPDAPGTFPVLLERTPYDKRNEVEAALTGAARGYVVVIQDVRGRYASQGDWYPFRHESDDGYDAVEWAARLPYSNGKVGMFGGSYVGATQMLAAIAHPPHLAGIFPVVTASNYHDGWTYQGGAFEQWFNESWTSGLAQDTLNRRVAGATNARQGDEVLPLTSYPLFNLGLLSQVAVLPRLAPYFLDWLAHPSYDEYWKRWSIEEHYPDIQVPAYVVAAWYDIFQGGSLRNYLGITEHGGSAEARAKTRLLVVIGGHAGGGPKIGEVDFGKQSVIDETGLTLDWYDWLLKGEQNDLAREKPVKLFVMGPNTWREESAWPPPEAKPVAYYLHSDGRANSGGGDGVLSTVAPTGEPADHFVYDPANPVPTTGGPLCCDGGHLAPGAFDQRKVEARSDVLVYTTPAFERDNEVTGPVSVDLYASSSTVDTDFTAKLVDVGPDGFARNLTEGIVRARYRDSQERPELMQPGTVYRLRVDLWSTANVFLAGHRLRLEISSSNFPRFDRNLNTGQDAAHSPDFVKTTNTVYHDREHPSTLTIDVVSP
ncbi:MAG TPA: CocE/NonD family hydrolase [Terriglobia bacterium]|nr:CocE/NonD family hydrolase [Terriglobia bacterium]